MKIEFDPDKNDKNIRERGISFELAADFDLTTAFIWTDTRKDYGETRYIALGYISKRLFSLAFTVRGDVMKIISMRKANQREVRGYEQQTKP
ncbi:MAG: BrnT family toxin [Methylomonas sp.]|jgi:uncharacterized DUF497 family protein